MTRSLEHVSSHRRPQQSDAFRTRNLSGPAQALLDELGAGGSGPECIDLSGIADAVARHGLCHNDAVALWEEGGTWASKYAASLSADPSLLTRMQVSSWVRDISDHTLCDCASVMFSRSRHAYALAPQWCMGRNPFTQRSGYAVIALLAREDLQACDCTFVAYVEMVRSLAPDISTDALAAAARALIAIASRSPSLCERVRRLAEDLGRKEQLADLVLPALSC